MGSRSRIFGPVLIVLFVLIILFVLSVLTALTVLSVAIWEQFGVWDCGQVNPPLI